VTSRLEERAGALAMAPRSVRRLVAGERLRVGTVRTALGWVALAATTRGIAAVRFGDDAGSLGDELGRDFPRAELVDDMEALAPWFALVREHLAGRSRLLELPLDVQGTTFQLRVWEALRAIPPGETRTHGELARDRRARRCASGGRRVRAQPRCGRDPLPPRSRRGGHGRLPPGRPPQSGAAPPRRRVAGGGRGELSGGRIRWRAAGARGARRTEAQRVRIGLLSDTHVPEAPVLFAEILEALRGVDLILHAGDIVVPRVLDELEVVAPVLAAQGNHDHLFDGDPRVRPLHLLEIEGHRVALVHQFEPLNAGREYLSRALLAGVWPDVVVCGDTHVERIDRIDGMLCVNPGSATLPRNRSPRLGHIGMLELVRGGAPRAWITDLGAG